MPSVPVTQKTPPGLPVETIEDRFRRLSATWHAETAFLSSMTAAERHPAYQEISRLGPAVVPLMLRDLEANHTHWFAALQSITGANPKPASGGGDIPRLVEAWVQWAKENGYKW